MTSDSPNKPRQPWEQLRKDVADQRDEGDSLERRVSALERRQHSSEVFGTKTLEGMSVAMQHLVKVVDKMVTKDQVDALRMQVNGLWIAVAIGVAVFIFKR